jgi:KUP system potassium uptake protein
MGLLPRMEVKHTSEKQFGQIFMPQINRLLFLGVAGLVLSFGSSANLASAYGIAVTGDMVITTILASVVFRHVWRWPVWVVGLVCLPLLTIESVFLASNLAKVVDGGWVPVLFATMLGIVIWTWVRGTAYVQRKARAGAVTVESLVGMLKKSDSLSEAPGTAVFLTSDPETAPSALMHNLKHNHVLHRQNMIVTVSVANTPYVSDTERITLERLSDRFTRVAMVFGYMEEPNVPKALMLARKQGQKFDIMSTSFFLNRRSFRSSPNEGLPVWQERLYIGLTKSASAATDFYRLPVNRVIELGQQLTI